MSTPDDGHVPLSREDAVRLLSDGTMELLGLMPGASNYTFLAEVCDAASSFLAIYKPRRGEAPLWDFPDGTLCNREVAAYLLAESLGWPDVPPTVLRDGPHGPGAVQLFVESDPEQHYFTLRRTRLADFATVAAFDVVANNADRKSGHCLVDPEGRIWLIDHGVCFHREPKLRTVIWEFAGSEIREDLRERLREVAQELREGDLRRSMLPLLSGSEVDAAARRAERLARVGRYPRPTGPRPYPWPPI